MLPVLILCVFLLPVATLSAKGTRVKLVNKSSHEINVAAFAKNSIHRSNVFEGMPGNGEAPVAFCERICKDQGRWNETARKNLEGGSQRGPGTLMVHGKPFPFDFYNTDCGPKPGTYQWECSCICNGVAGLFGAKLTRAGGSFEEAFEAAYINTLRLTTGIHQTYLVTWWGTKDGKSDTPAWIDLVFEDGPGNSIKIRSNDPQGTFVLNGDSSTPDNAFKSETIWNL